MADVLIEQNTPLRVFVNTPAAIVLDRISVVADTETGLINAAPQQVDILAQTQVSTIVDTLEIIALPFSPLIDVFVPRERTSTNRRVHRSAWQARLAGKLDPVKRKVLDNNMMLSGFPIDMIRIQVTRDKRTGDLQSRTVVANEIVPVIFPELKDIPFRRLQRDNDRSITLSIDMSEEGIRKVDAYAPFQAQLERDDLLIRIWNEPLSDYPYITVFQVKDQLGTFTTNTLYYVKHHLSIFDEQLPPQIISTIVDVARKRGNLKW